MAYRGDLIGCTVKFDLAKDGKVPIVFYLNGRPITEHENEILMEYTHNGKLYPYIGMGHTGLRVLAKVSVFFLIIIFILSFWKVTMFAHIHRIWADLTRTFWLFVPHRLSSLQSLNLPSYMLFSLPFCQSDYNNRSSKMNYFIYFTSKRLEFDKMLLPQQVSPPLFHALFSSILSKRLEFVQDAPTTTGITTTFSLLLFADISQFSRFLLRIPCYKRRLPH